MHDTELNALEEQYYQLLIGILQWIVELGRVDIIAEVSRLALCMELPREWYLEAVVTVFTYLKLHHNAQSVYELT